MGTILEAAYRVMGAGFRSGEVVAPRFSPRGWQAVLVVIVLALLIAAYLPLLSATGIFYDDFPAAYLRIHQYAREFAAGYLPQVLPDVVRGGGSAFPRFYPPLAYYVGAAAYGVVGDFVLAGNLTALLSILLSAATMAWSLGLLGATPTIAAVGGLAYGTFPYRFTNVLIRGALAESWALVWLPLVLAFAVRLAQDRRSGTGLACTVGLLMTTHTSLALWAIPFLLAVGLLVSPAGQRAQAVQRIACYGALGVGLASWYLFPMWFYLPEVRASDPSVMWATASEFASGRLQWGNVLGFGVLTWNPQTGALLPVPMPVSIGVSALVVPVAMLLCARRTRLDPWLVASGRLVLVLGVAAAFVAALMVRPGVVAGWIPQPWLYLQFPYRLAGIAGMLAIVTTALAVQLSSRPVGSVMLAVWAVLVGATAAMGPSVPNQMVSEGDLLPLLRSRDKGLTARYDYLPRTARPEQFGPRIEAARQVLRERAIFLTDTTNRFEATVSASDTIQLTLPRIRYDFLDVRLVGEGVVPTGSDDGLLSVQVQPGMHTIKITRRTPAPMLLGMALTILSAAGLALPLVRGRRARRLASARPHVVRGGRQY